MIFEKMMLIPIFILLTYTPYQFLKNQETENENVFLHGFLIIYLLASLFLLFSAVRMAHISMDHSVHPHWLLPLIVVVWAIVAIGLFLHQLDFLFRHLISFFKISAVGSRYSAAGYTLLYIVVSFLLAFYWFHPAIWYWYRSAVIDIFPHSVTKENHG